MLHLDNSWESGKIALVRETKTGPSWSSSFHNLQGAWTEQSGRQHVNYVLNNLTE